jgi:hypothetical protein
MMREAHYVVSIWCACDEQQAAERIASFLARPTVMRRRRRKGRLVEYDLRPLVHTLAAAGRCEDRLTMTVVAQCGPGGSGRPEDVLDELGLAEHRYDIERVRLVWEGPQT